MNILSISSVEELKSLGTMKSVRADLKKLTGNNIKIKTNTWNNMYLSIIEIRKLINKASNAAVDQSIIMDINSEDSKNEDKYFINERKMYIFALAYMYGESRNQLIGLNDSVYENLKNLKKWYRNICKIIDHDDNDVDVKNAFINLRDIYETIHDSFMED
jgi:hypothetical protein